MQTIGNKDVERPKSTGSEECLIPIASGPNKRVKHRKNTIVSLHNRQRQACEDVPAAAHFRKKWICTLLLLIVASIQLWRTLHLRSGWQHGFESIYLHDYEHVHGIFDLSTRSDLITDRCYPGRKKFCTCGDPMMGSSREGQRHWSKAHHENVDSVKGSNEVDVVFLGDSITEGWKGTSYGFENGRKKDNPEVFQSLFTSDGGGKYEGLVLGISGDTSTSLLWRMQNGELPSSLNPSLFWVLIGTNDMANDWCSPEATLIGILRVVEELRSKKPGSTIVINGLLPRSFDKKNGFVMRNKLPLTKKDLPSLWQDILVINRQLKDYSAQHDGVEYFDASDIFLVNEAPPTNKLQIDVNLMSDYLHPNAEGYRKWGERIIEILDQLIGN